MTATAKHTLISDTKPLTYVVLGLIVSFSFWFSSWQNDFSNQLHADEYKKTEFINGKTPDFHHPLLIIRLGAISKSLLSNERSTVEAGRLVSAVAVSFTVFLLFLSFRHFLGDEYALVCAFIYATVPIISVHAHYLKEDILLTFCLIFFLYASQQRILTHGKPIYLILMTLALGLSFSTHYKSVLLVGVMIWHFRDLRLDFPKAAGILIGAVVVFFVINFGFQSDYEKIFSSGLGEQTLHSLGGHTVDFYPVPYLFLFHAVNSLGTGMGILIPLIAFLGLGLALKEYHQLSKPFSLWITYFVVFYLVIEISPTKPHPDFSRYAIPCVPPMILLFGYCCKKYQSRLKPFILYPVLILAVLIPLFDSYSIISNLKSDTRFEIMKKAQMEWGISDIRGNKQVLVLPNSGMGGKEITYLPTHDFTKLREMGYSYVYVTSFWYDRFFKGEKLNMHTRVVYDNAAFYHQLFDEYQFIEVNPHYRPYAFSNPTVRIVDIREPSGE